MLPCWSHALLWPLQSIDFFYNYYWKIILGSLKHACCLEPWHEKASEWFNHISAVPWEELSACHQPQSHYQQSALHRRGRTAQPSLPFFSFHLLLPFCAAFPSFPGFSPIAYGIFFLCLTLKTLARKTDMWNFLVFQWEKSGGKKPSWLISIQFHCSLTLFDPESWSPDGKNAAPECKSGPCLVLTFRSLISGSNVKHLPSWTQKYELLKYFYCSKCILVQCLCLF